MPIYTKKGDQGETGLLCGARVSKSSLRVEALGSIDEANASIGLLVAMLSIDDNTYLLLTKTQSYLFSCGSNIACSSMGCAADIKIPNDECIQEYEKEIDILTNNMPKLTQFILPGGCELAARAHYARTVIRRAERSVIALKDNNEYFEASIIKLLNRLSDYFFTLARFYNYREGADELVWKNNT